MATKLVSLGPEFVAQRCAALDAFLKRCAAHATLRASPHLAAFLEAPEGAWAAQAAVPLPRDALTLAKQREAQGPLGAAALKELGRNAAALLAGRPDANDAEYDRVSARSEAPSTALPAASSRQRMPFISAADDAPVSAAQMRAYFTELDSHLTECQQSIDKLIRRQGSACPVSFLLALMSLASARIFAVHCADIAFCCAELAGALKDFGVAMGELGKSQSGDAASSLAALAQCCASLAASSGAKAVAMQASVDVPMRDLVRSLQGVRGALSARHAAHTTHLATLQELEGKRLKLAKLREGGKADAARLAGEERDAAQAATQADTARHEYGELCERMAAELLRADAQRAQQLATVTRALGIAQRELAADQAAAFDLMRTVRAAT